MNIAKDDLEVVAAAFLLSSAGLPENASEQAKAVQKARTMAKAFVEAIDASGSATWAKGSAATADAAALQGETRSRERGDRAPDAGARDGAGRAHRRLELTGGEDGGAHVSLFVRRRREPGAVDGRQRRRRLGDARARPSAVRPAAASGSCAGVAPSDAAVDSSGVDQDEGDEAPLAAGGTTSPPFRARDAARRASRLLDARTQYAQRARVARAAPHRVLNMAASSTVNAARRAIGSPGAHAPLDVTREPQVVGMLATLLVGSRFAPRRSWRDAVLVLDAGIAKRIESRVAFASWLRANGLEALSREARARVVRPGEVLVFVTADDAERSGARFCVVELDAALRVTA
jgi:hypothetical protein